MLQFCLVYLSGDEILDRDSGLVPSIPQMAMAGRRGGVNGARREMAPRRMSHAAIRDREASPTNQPTKATVQRSIVANLRHPCHLFFRRLKVGKPSRWRPRPVSVKLKTMSATRSKAAATIRCPSMICNIFEWEGKWRPIYHSFHGAA